MVSHLGRQRAGDDGAAASADAAVNAADFAELVSIQDADQSFWVERVGLVVHLKA